MIADDFLTDGPHHGKLLRLREQVPIAFHSVGLNIGGVDPFPESYLSSFRKLYEKYEPAWISDHLCWSAHNGKFHHDLLPIPKTKEAFQKVSERIESLQDYFQRELCLENITSYIDYKNEEFDEIEFIEALVQKTGCKLLLDVSNVLINHQNRKFNPKSYFDRFPLHSVLQVHLSGGSWDEGVVIDSHSNKIPSEDVEVLSRLQRRGLNVPVLLERDADLPDFAELEQERVDVSRRLNELL